MDCGSCHKKILCSPVQQSNRVFVKLQMSVWYIIMCCPLMDSSFFKATYICQPSCLHGCKLSLSAVLILHIFAMTYVVVPKIPHISQPIWCTCHGKRQHTEYSHLNKSRHLTGKCGQRKSKLGRVCHCLCCYTG